ncbi:MAG: hypothetical protein H0X62_00960 [Bacteroidetes bacterium]|nr:hypothetical protein [Bacteroidota bacterium]
MPARYQLTQKFNPNVLITEPKYDASALSKGIIHLDSLDRIVSKSCLSSTGIFCFTLHSKGLEDSQHFTSGNMKHVKLFYKS